MTYDVIVIGGAAAGLSGALTLARARRSVLVLDGGEPRNAPADGVHGFLTRDGMRPAELVEMGRTEVRGYGGEVRGAKVAAAERDGDGFAVTLDEGGTEHARTLLVATGLHDELPAIPGLRERFGHDVVHCPYCHGWEIRDRAIGVLGLSEHAVHQALLFRGWSDDLTLFRHTAPAPTEEQAAQLAARGIAVVDGEVAALEADGVRMRDGRLVAREAMAVMPRFVARTAGLEGLGLRVVEHPMGVGEHVEVDATGRTSVPGVWAAGNVADLMATVVGAADQGVRAAAMINMDLLMSGVQLAEVA
jgi:thioredoxin reductase